MTGEVQKKPQTLFSPSHSDELDLPDLHKALIGLSGRTFDAALDLTGRSAIDAVDASGRTALSWAAERGDGYALSRLLMCGADPNIADLCGKTPLHWGASAGEARCVQTLLLAKADIEAQDKRGFTALCHAAIAGSDRLLIAGGAETIKFLLASGADVPGLDSNALSALDLAIWNNAPKALQLLLDHNIELKSALRDYHAFKLALRYIRYRLLAITFQPSILDWTADRGKFSILNSAAHWADIVSVGMLLTQSKSLRKSLSAVDIDSLLQYVPLRWDHNQSWSDEVVAQPDEDPDAWYNAFEALVNRNRRAGHTKENCDIHDPHVDESDHTDAGDTWEDAQERMP